MSTLLDGCAIVSRPYLPVARVLAHSFLDHHPGARFVVMTIDEAEPGQRRADDRFALTDARTVVGDADLERLAALYPPLELACALKPRLLAHLLDDGSDAVVYLDSDMRVYAPLIGVADHALASGVVLTPHLLVPPPDDGLVVEEAEMLRFGTFNAGFVAVAGPGRPFLAWWAERLRRGCVFDEAAGVYADQKWLDLAPSYVGCHILRDAGVNVAYWNLAERPVTATSDGALAAGPGPLRLFHFSGFDPATPGRLHRSHPPERLRARVEPGSALADMLAAHASDLVATRSGGDDRVRYLYGHASDGVALTAPVRGVYRDALIEAERTGRPEPPSPVSREAVGAFTRWAQRPAGPRRQLTRFAVHLWQSSADVRRAFPEVAQGDAGRYAPWLASEAGRALAIAPELLAHAPVAPELAGARSLIVLAHVDEVVATPALLARYCGAVGRDDDATLVLYAPGYDEARLGDELGAVLEGIGRSDEDAPDMLGVVSCHDLALLASSIDAVLSDAPPAAPFQGVPALRLRAA